MHKAATALYGFALVPDKIVFDFELFDRSHTIEFKLGSDGTYRLTAIFCAVRESPSNAWSGLVAASDVAALWATVQELVTGRSIRVHAVIADGTLVKVRASASPPLQFLIGERGEWDERFETAMRRCLATVQDAELVRRIGELF